MSTVHFPLFGDSLGPIFKLMLRQPQELGDRAFLKAVLLPRKKAESQKAACEELGKFSPCEFQNVI